MLPGDKHNDTLSVVIGTYGDTAYWYPQALKAAASVENQSVKAKEVVHCHAGTLQEARNQGASETTSDWLVFLDADDTLDSHYIEGVLKGDGDLRQPRTLGVYENGITDPEAVFIPAKDHFCYGNWLIIGTGVRRELFEAAGGFGPEPLYEDWSLWWRCWLEGGELGKAPESIYRISIRENSRNNPNIRLQQIWFRQIAGQLSSKRRKVS